MKKGVLIVLCVLGVLGLGVWGIICTVSNLKSTYNFTNAAEHNKGKFMAAVCVRTDADRVDIMYLQTSKMSSKHDSGVHETSVSLASDDSRNGTTLTDQDERCKHFIFNAHQPGMFSMLTIVIEDDEYAKIKEGGGPFVCRPTPQSKSVCGKMNTIGTIPDTDSTMFQAVFYTPFGNGSTTPHMQPISMFEDGQIPHLSYE